jgi:hypothetical protein
VLKRFSPISGRNKCYTTVIIREMVSCVQIKEKKIRIHGGYHSALVLRDALKLKQAH